MTMEYTVQKLGALAGISTRTLRYYDEFGILKPARIPRDTASTARPRWTGCSRFCFTGSWA